jgi:hypothetical protein
MAMMAMTTNNSIRVNAERIRRMGEVSGEGRGEESWAYGS